METNIQANNIELNDVSYYLQGLVALGLYKHTWRLSDAGDAIELSYTHFDTDTISDVVKGCER
jgi:hypothetical protein